MGKQQQAEELVASMQAELKTVAARSGDSSRPRVFVEIWDDPLTTVGGTSFLDDVIARAGGVNVAHEISLPHPRISAEKVIEWNPEVIVVAHMNRGPTSAAQMAERIGWADIAAVKNGRVMCDIPPESDPAARSAFDRRRESAGPTSARRSLPWTAPSREGVALTMPILRDRKSLIVYGVLLAALIAACAAFDLLGRRACSVGRHARIRTSFNSAWRESCSA